MFLIDYSSLIKNIDLTYMYNGLSALIVENKLIINYRNDCYSNNVPKSS